MKVTKQNEDLGFRSLYRKEQQQDIEILGCDRAIRTPSLGYEPSELPLLHHRDI